MYRILWLTISACLLCIGCKTLTPVPHSPSAKTKWKGAPWSSDDKASDATGSKAPTPKEDIRRQTVTMAKNLLTKGEESPGFGEEDLDQIFKNLQVKVLWQADQNLKRLVTHARKKGAYKAEGEPKAGDIVLFHNQRDLNANRRNDDWLTGAGIVVDVQGDIFEAVTRTGHAPRRITVCPADPSHRQAGNAVINSYARIPTKADPGDTAYLAGQLYAGHIDIEKLATE